MQRLLPERSAEEREAILRGVIRHRVFDRAIFLLHTSAPRLAVWVARLVPIDASSEVTRAAESGAPLIMASGHFGPLFFQALVLKRLLPNRRIIIVLRQQALYLRRALPFLRQIGVDYVIDKEHSLRTLIRSMQDDPRTVVMFALDHTHEGRRIVPFLGAKIATCNGIALIAELGRAQIVLSLWQWVSGRPRVRLSGPYGVDRMLPRAEGRDRLLSGLYRLLETWVAEAPDQWSGWEYIVPRIVATATSSDEPAGPAMPAIREPSPA